MKKILALIFALCLCASAFAGCAEEKANKNEESNASQTESKPDTSAPNGEVSVPENSDKILVGVWTGSDKSATGTYIFNEGGRGNFVSYTDKGRTVNSIKWGTEGNLLSVSFDGANMKVEYEYRIGEGEIVLTTNGISTVYKSGPNPADSDNKKHETDSTLVGTWKCKVDGYVMTYVLEADGDGTMVSGEGTKSEEFDLRWYVDGEKLFFSMRNMGVEVALEEYTYRMEDGDLYIIYKDRYANKYEKADGESTEESAEESSKEVLDYPKNGGDDNMAGSWYGEGFDMELEADGTGRCIEGDKTYDAFWGIRDGQFYFTYIKDEKPQTKIYDYIADGGKLYLTDSEGAETVFNSTAE